MRPLWAQFGSPLIGVWDPRLGFSWWQDDGYRTGAFYLRFGAVLAHPWFSSFKSFADGVYATLWGDGLFGGMADALAPPALELRSDGSRLLAGTGALGRRYWSEAYWCW